MGRTSILTKISDEINVENNNDNNWLVAYDFPKSKGNPHFYTLFKQLLNKLNGVGVRAERIQSSIFLTDDFHGAITATKLAQYYCADVLLFKVEEVDLFSFSVEQEYPDFDFGLDVEEIPVVMKAVYHGLKKHYSSFSQSSQNEICELSAFLWRNKFSTRPDSPINRNDLGRILKEFVNLEHLEYDRILKEYHIVSYYLEDFNFFVIIKTVEEYFKKGKLDSMEYDIIYDLFQRIDEDEEIPSELKRQIKGIL